MRKRNSVDKNKKNRYHTDLPEIQIVKNKEASFIIMRREKSRATFLKQSEKKCMVWTG